MAIYRKPCDSVESVLNNEGSWANGFGLNAFPSFSGPIHWIY